jgi:anti-sigma factor RsiW
MSEMHCNEFVELVTDFLDGALSEEDQARFVDHLALCDGCDAYLDQVRLTVTSLSGLPAVQGLPDAARTRLLDAFRKQAGHA